jgi:hypothetical protein
MEHSAVNQQEGKCHLQWMTRWQVQWMVLWLNRMPVLHLVQLLIQVNKDLPWIHLRISKMMHHQLKVRMI